MKYHLIIILTIILPTTLFGQVDYMELESKLTRICGVPDSITLVTNQQFLDSLIEMDVINGKEKLLRDIGMTYYKRYLKWKGLSDIEKSKDYFIQSWEIYNSKLSLWDLGACYGILDDCQEKLRLTELYIKVMKEAEQEEFISYKQVYLRYKFCD